MTFGQLETLENQRYLNDMVSAENVDAIFSFLDQDPRYAVFIPHAFEFAINLEKEDTFWAIANKYDNIEVNMGKMSMLFIQAAHKGYTDIVKHLMAQCTDKLTPTDYHEICIAAIRNNHTDLLEYMFSTAGGADINRTTQRQNKETNLTETVSSYANVSLIYGAIDSLNLVLRTPENQQLFFTETNLKSTLLPARLAKWIKNSPEKTLELFDNLKNFSLPLYQEFIEKISKIENYTELEEFSAVYQPDMNNIISYQAFFDKLKLENVLNTTNSTEKLDSSVNITAKAWKI